jgi:hypothetical protein
MREPDLQPYLERLEQLPFVRSARVVAGRHRVRDWALDAIVQLETPDGSVDLPVQYRGTTMSATIAEQVRLVSSRVPGLLALAPVVASGHAENLAAAAVNFLDLAGNCHVRIGDRYIARIEGRRPESRAPGEKALRGPAYRVLCALLAKPTLVDATARELAAESGGVSPQTANDVRHRLVARGPLVATRSGLQWAPDGYQSALELFLGGFPTLLPALTLGRFRARARTPEEVEESLRPGLEAVGRWRWGGAAGAWHVTRFYRGDHTLIYFDDPDRAALAQLPLVSDTRGNVTLRRVPAPAALHGQTPETVHPALLYADLLAEGNSRARDAAADIHAAFLTEGARS